VFAYVLHLIGAVAGVTSIIGLVLNYARRDRYGVWDTHHRWMIRSFWWGLLWGVIGWCLVFVVIGWAILGIAWLWYIYRHIRGLIAIANNDPMPG
jgi:uncharacterized membrane protein